MKIILLLTLVLLVLCGCESKTKESNELREKFKPFIEGIWVRADYIKDLKKTRSPYKSKSKLRGVAEMQIALQIDNTDSASVGYSLNNHEGSGFVLYFKKGHLPNSLRTGLPDYKIESNFYELGYFVKHQDTILKIYHCNKNNEIIGENTYSKVANKGLAEDDAAWGIEYITNKILISGSYLFTDSVGKKSEVVFNDKGIVSGFLGFKKFYINTDFEAGPENNIDDITFDLYSKTTSPYTFQFKSDTLFLFKEEHNVDSTKLLVGKLKYMLVRKK